MGRKNHYIFGFTIVEVVIIVSILVFLGSMVLNLAASQVYKGNDAKRKGDLDRIRIAVEEYEKDKNCFPSSNLLSSPQTDMLPYLNSIPKDPRTGDYYYYEVPTASCAYYYKLYAKLENEKDGDIAKTDCSGGCGPGNAYNYKITSSNAP